MPLPVFALNAWLAAVCDRAKLYTPAVSSETGRREQLGPYIRAEGETMPAADPAELFVEAETVVDQIVLIASTQTEYALAHSYIWELVRSGTRYIRQPEAFGPAKAAAARLQSRRSDVDAVRPVVADIQRIHHSW